MFKPFASDGFPWKPIVKIGRNVRLDKIIILRGAKVVTRRRTVGFVATPRRPNNSVVNQSPRNTPPVPQLIPLKSALKMPAQLPFNVRGRKSMFASVSSGSPMIPKGTTKQIILNRIASTSAGASPQPSTSAAAMQSPGTVQPGDVTMTNPVGTIRMGQLRYSDSEDSD